MNDLAINTSAAAFVAGIITSLHCSAMCGPLLCAALPKPSASYHFGRILSYTAVGAVCGAVGKFPLDKILNSPAVLLPWALVVVLVVVALGFKPSLPRPFFLKKWYARTIFMQRERWKGLGLGLLTPLLPCGPLYLLFGASLLSGSAVAGANFAAAFAMGTIPLLWISQLGFNHIRSHITPQRLAIVQRVFALLAAIMIAWRLKPTLTAQSVAEAPCPLCTHD